MTIKTRSYPRAALIGNPSDGYFGKTIAFVFSNFSVEVELEESDKIQFIPGDRDRIEYQTLTQLYGDIQSYGYYGGIRLLKATVKKFVDYCQEKDIQIPDRCFTLRYQSSIPKRLGLAGSSAIITAAMRAISKFYDVSIEPGVLANIVLSTEADELWIGAGLQDRVAQAYEAPVYMDFNKEVMQKKGWGSYETFSSKKLPALYIAYRTNLSEGSEVVHNDLRDRYNAGDSRVREAMIRFAELTDEAFTYLKNEEPHRLGYLMNENFDLRNSIMHVTPENVRMVELARSVGASAKFTGSGGAIIGTFSDKAMYEELKNLFIKHEIEILIPEIVDTGKSEN